MPAVVATGAVDTAGGAPPSTSPPDVGGGPGAPRSPPPAGWRCSSPSPATTCPASPSSGRLRWRWPSAASGCAAARGWAWCSGWLLAAAAVLDRRLRRPFPWLALGVFEALYFAVLGGGAAATSRLPGWPLWAAALWVADEALRGRWPMGGFPWGRLGFSQVDGPFTALAAYGGVPLVSFAVALTGTLLAAAVLAVSRVARAGGTTGLRAGVLALVGVLAVPLVGALAGLPLAGASLTEGGPTRTVAVIQGNVPRPGWTSTPSAAPCWTTTPQQTQRAGRRRRRRATRRSPTWSSGRRTAPTSTRTATPTRAP